MARKTKSKKVYNLDDEILVEFKSVLRIKVRDLDIHPEFMSEGQVRQIVAREVDTLIRESDSIEPVAHSVNLIAGSTRSTLKDVDEKQSE